MRGYTCIEFLRSHCNRVKEFVASITQRSQVTIPARVRRALGLKARDKVAFTIEHDGVRLKPARFTLESAYGSVKPSRTPEDFEAISRTVKEARAEKALGKLKGG